MKGQKVYDCKRMCKELDKLVITQKIVLLKKCAFVKKRL